MALHDSHSPADNHCDLLATNRMSRKNFLYALSAAVLLSAFFWAFQSFRGNEQAHNGDLPADTGTAGNKPISAGVRQGRIYGAEDKGKKFQDRLKTLKRDVDTSRNPGAIFSELAQTILDAKHPLEQRGIAADIFNKLADFETPDDCINWLTINDAALEHCFSQVPLQFGCPDAYSGFYAVCAGRIMMKNDGDAIAALLAKPELELPHSAKVKLLTEVVNLSGDYSLLDSFDTDTRQKCLVALLEGTNRMESQFGIRSYLSGEYREVQDSNGELLGRMVTPRWVRKNSGELVRIIDSADPGPKRDNLIRLSVSLLEESDPNYPKILSYMNPPTAE